MRDRTLECVRKNLCDRGRNGAKALRLEQAWRISGVSSVAGGGCQRSRAGVHRALKAIVGICILFCVHWEALSRGKLLSGFMLKKKNKHPPQGQSEKEQEMELSSAFLQVVGRMLRHPQASCSSSQSVTVMELSFINRLSVWPGHVTWDSLSLEDREEIRTRMVRRAWCVYLALKMEGSTSWGMWTASRSWERPLAHSQQGNGCLCSTDARREARGQLK